MPIWRPLVIFLGASPNCNLMFRFAFHGNKVVHTLAVGWGESRGVWGGGGRDRCAESVALSGGVWKPNERCPFGRWSASASLHRERERKKEKEIFKVWTASLSPLFSSLPLPSSPHPLSLSVLHLLRVCLLEAASFFACGANWLVPKLYKNWNRNATERREVFPPPHCFPLAPSTLTTRWEIRLRLDCVWKSKENHV